MSETIRSIVDWISNNRLASVLPPILAVAGWVLKWLRDKRDGNRIYDFLLKSAATTPWRFRSTEAISSATHLPRRRVEKLCIRDKRIKRNEKEKESWQLI
jgi:hypothetical protein